MGRSDRSLIGRLGLLAGLAAAVCGCSTLPTTDAAVARLPAPESPEQRTAPPTQSARTALLEQSRGARAAGDYAGAAAAIERALRIEPDDPALWLEYAELRMAQGDYAQAASLARKSASLAGGDRAVQAAALRLVDDAEEAQRP